MRSSEQTTALAVFIFLDSEIMPSESWGKSCLNGAGWKKFPNQFGRWAVVAALLPVSSPAAERWRASRGRSEPFISDNGGLGEYRKLFVA